MRLTFNIEDTVASTFLSSIPDRMRSKVVTELIRRDLEEKKKAIIAACIAANQDTNSEAAIDEWQSFDTTIEGDWK